MAKKASLPWVVAVGETIRERLIRRQGRPFNFHQAGPYTKRGELHTDIYFNENEPGQKSSRFGYQLCSRLIQPGAPESRVFRAGFGVFDPRADLDRFRPRLRAHLDGIAENVWNWIEKQDHVRFYFSSQGGNDFNWTPSLSVEALKEKLMLYADPEKPSPGATDQSGLSVRTEFLLLKPLDAIDQMSDGQIELQADRIAQTASFVFDGLSFLYELLLPPGEKLASSETQLSPGSHAPTLTPATSPVEKQHDPDEIPPLELSDPESGKDERTRVFADIVQRQGQGVFRDSLLKAYGGKCAVTGCSVGEVLQAAHIEPYTGEKSSHIGNGLLLRADIHNLFDRHLLTVDPKNNKIEVSPSLLATEYAKFHGLPLHLPNDSARRPDPNALAHHYNQRPENASSS